MLRQQPAQVASSFSRRGWIASALLFAAVLGTAAALVAWKQASIRDSHAAAANQPEPMVAVTAALAQERESLQTTTSIGTVVALRSITLRNELAGTVREVDLPPGAIVEEGAVLVALDVAVEEAELHAQEAQAALAESSLGRMQRASQNRGASAIDVDRAKAERDVALANVARTQAVIARKTIRAPFRARVGISDVHPGQYLQEGTQLTTLQGVDDAAYVDFSVAQAVAAGLEPGDTVDVVVESGAPPVAATVAAIDARIDRATRNAMVRATIDDPNHVLAPGASVRVRIPVGEPGVAVAVPVSALRKGPSGDHVFVLEPDGADHVRAHVRPVVSGSVLGDEVVIRSGLAAGERVAASGSFKLYESALVGIAPEGAAPARE
jgi:membrane fusion protein (multidrug efflux system)